MPTTLDDIMVRLDNIEQELKALQEVERSIPMNRLYTRKQAGFRIVHGQDPDRIPEGPKKELMREAALSERWMDDRLADDDCVLRRTRLGRKVFIAERNVQRFLKTRRST